MQVGAGSWRLPAVAPVTAAAAAKLATFRRCVSLDVVGQPWAVLVVGRAVVERRTAGASVPALPSVGLLAGSSGPATDQPSLPHTSRPPLRRYRPSTWTAPMRAVHTRHPPP